MRTLLLFLLALPALATPPVVSNIQFYSLSHSDVQVAFTAGSAFNDIRLRYIAAPSTCTDGSGSLEYTSGASVSSTTTYSIALGGLSPSTEYDVCPEVSNDGGSTWSSGVDAIFRTLALPAIHPAQPIPPATFDASYPDTSLGGTCNISTASNFGQPGYCVIPEPVSGNICSQLDGDINSAIAQQSADGAVIEIPAGDTCVGQLPVSTYATDTVVFDSTKVNSVGANAIYSPAHGLSEGQGIVFDYDFNTEYGGGSMTVNGAAAHNGYAGHTFFVHVIDANDFQIYPNWQQFTASTTNGSTTVSVQNMLGGTGRACGFQNQVIGCSSGVGSPVIGPSIPSGTTISAYDVVAGTITLSQAATATASDITITTAGTTLATLAPGGTTAQRYAKWPRSSLYWIIIRTSTPDSQFDPLGVRVSPAWASKMATLQMPEMTRFIKNPADALMSLGSASDVNGNYWASHFRFTGIKFTYTTPTVASSDPVSHMYILQDLWQGNSDIVFDRDWFTEPDTPQDRVMIPVEYDGRDFAMLDSYVDNIHEWYPHYSGQAADTMTGAAPTASVGGTSMTIPVYTGIYYGAPAPAALPNGLTVSWTGSTTVTNPELAVYFDMNDALQVIAPQGLTVTAPGATITYISTGGTPTCSESDPVLPKTTYGRQMSAPLGCVALNASGTITAIYTPSITQDDAHLGSSGGGSIFFQQTDTAGDGDYIFDGNYFNVEGTNAIMFQDSGAPSYGGDYTITRNYFVMNLKHMLTDANSYAKSTTIPSDGYQYGVRQFVEWKGGQRGIVDGNIFDSSYHEVTQAPNPTITAYFGSVISDILVENNTFKHFVSGPNLLTGSDTCPSCPPDSRIKISNNLFWDMNGFVYSTGSGTNFGNAPVSLGQGYMFQGGHRVGEDAIVEHNTFVDDNSRVSPILIWGGLFLEGLRFDNNIISANMGWDSNHLFWGQNNSTTNVCSSSDALTATALSCYMPGMEMKGNVFIPGWQNSGWPLGSNPASGSNANGQATQATINTTLGTFASQNTVIPDSSVSASMAALGWQSDSYTSGAYGSDGFYDGPVPNWRLLSTSLFNSQSGSYIGATDGRQAGVDINALEAAQGKVTLGGANQVAGTNANITYVAPDSAACYVDYGDSDSTLINSFTRVSDGGGDRVRNVTLSGLISGQTYYYRVDCRVQQPTGQFATP